MGTVGVWVDDPNFEAFVRNVDAYDRIVTRHDGTWGGCTSCASTSVLPTQTKERRRTSDG
jgi:hypothetical protein